MIRFGKSEKSPDDLLDRIIELIRNPFLKWNNCVVGDGDMLGADFGATLGNIAVADPLRFLQLGQAIGFVQWMHF